MICAICGEKKPTPNMIRGEYIGIDSDGDLTGGHGMRLMSCSDCFYKIRKNLEK